MAACTLVIAGLRLELIVDNPKLAHAIRARYSAFGAGMRSNGHASHLRTRVRTTTEPWGAEAAEIHFPPQGLILATSNCRGSIDLAAGSAVVDLERHQPVDSLDYFVRVAVAVLAFEAGGMLLHAAGVLSHGRAHIFIGRSGSGKTTLARLAGPRPVLNDDLVVVLPSATGWRAYATPFTHAAQVPPTGPLDAPIAGLYTLTQDGDVYLTQLSSGQALATLVANAPVVNGDPGRLRSLLARLAILAQSVPVRDLHFRPDPTCWDLIDGSMPADD
jgi:hypothetical protein